jgi:hypothetical protein
VADADPLKADTARLRALAEAATPGPWEVPESIHGDPYINEVGKGTLIGGNIALANTRDDYGRSNAAYIAAANPAVVLALLDRLERAEGRLRSRRCGCGWCCASTPPDDRGETHKRTCQPKPLNRPGTPAGDEASPCIECGDHRGWTVVPDRNTGEASQQQCRACSEHECPLSRPGNLSADDES